MVLPPEPSQRRGDLTNRQWQRLQPMLSPQKPRVGRPSLDHRTTINGILWVLRTGAPWRDLPGCYGAWATVSGRFYRWQRSGLWQQILETLQQQADREGKFNWQLHHVDGSVIRAHPHAAGAKKGSYTQTAVFRQSSKLNNVKHWATVKAVAPRFICALTAMADRSRSY